MFTLALILLVGLALLAMFLRISVVRTTANRGGRSSLRGLIVYLAVVVVAAAAGRHVLHHEQRIKPPDQAAEAAFPNRPRQKPAPVSKSARSPEIVWPLVAGAVVLAASAFTAFVIGSRRRRSRASGATSQSRQELAEALDEALDDLRREPDPRRAVVAAYARMEQALLVFGIPRVPAEAPYEYLERAGRALDAEESVATLTNLFELAKFSEHAIDEPMRTEAIEALSAVRDEVRAAA